MRVVAVLLLAEIAFAATAQEVKIERDGGKVTVTVTLNEAPLLGAVKAAKTSAAGGAVGEPKVKPEALRRVFKLAALREARKILQEAEFALAHSDERVAKDAEAEKARLCKAVDAKAARIKAARPKGNIKLPDVPDG